MIFKKSNFQLKMSFINFRICAILHRSPEQLIQCFRDFSESQAYDRYFFPHAILF